ARPVRLERVQRDVGERDQAGDAGDPGAGPDAAGRALHAGTATPDASRERSRASRRSASMSTAGNTASTPSNDTVRSTTVTSPNSWSILTSDRARTAKPAIAVRPEASTVAPVER